MKTAHQNINADSGNFEYYTDPIIIEAARLTMGNIDLDPASSHAANINVKARAYFTKEFSGLEAKWFGNVFMNHPFSDSENACLEKCKKKRCNPAYENSLDRPRAWRGYCIDEYSPGNAEWINKLVAEYESGNIIQSCNISFASTSEGWFQPLAQYPQCSLAPRTNYFLQDGTKKKGVTKGSVVTYMGENIHQFAEAFKELGTIKVKYAP